MKVLIGGLDCEPLGPAETAPVSDADLRRIEPLQRVLLSALDHESVDAWRSAVNAALINAFDSTAAMFQLDMEGVPLQYSNEFERSDLGQYVQELMPRFARDRRLYRRAEELKVGNRATIWAGHLDWLYQSAYFNELVVPMLALDPLWAAVSTGDTRYPAMIHTYHDLGRSRRFFNAVDVTLMRVVHPALEAGVRTIMQTAANRASLALTLETRRDGALIYDCEGHLLHRTRSVARITRTRRAEKMIVDAGRQMARALGAPAIEDRLHPANATRALKSRTGEYRLHATMLREGMFGMKPTVLISVSPAEHRLPDRGALQQRWSLTRRQAEVAVLLARRKTNPEIAEALCISIHTARSHTEAVMGKMGVHDRRDIAPALTREADAIPGVPEEDR